jgi:hypothetical protein
VIYIDTSALRKLVDVEAESMPLRTWLARHPDDLLSSALTRAEARRAQLRNDPDRVAAAGPSAGLRSSDPDHGSDFGSSRSAGRSWASRARCDSPCERRADTGITTVLVYDKKLAEAARRMRMTVARPA